MFQTCQVLSQSGLDELRAAFPQGKDIAGLVDEKAAAAAPALSR